VSLQAFGVVSSMLFGSVLACGGKTVCEYDAMPARCGVLVVVLHAVDDDFERDAHGITKIIEELGGRVERADAALGVVVAQFLPDTERLARIRTQLTHLSTVKAVSYDLIAVPDS
jgi:hypothetical protein